MTPHELFSQLGIRYMATGHEHCRDGWLQVDCPFCSKNSQHWRMGFNLTFHYFHCWQCGHHSLVETICALAGPNLSFKALKPILAELAADSHCRATQSPLRGKLKLPARLGPLLKPHRRFLESRGFNPKEIEEVWGVKGIGVAGELAWRIFIPITLNGQVVSWTTRSIVDNHSQRYRSADKEDEAVPKSELLYGEDHCRHAIAVQEGHLDVWAIGPGAVATGGTGYSRAQLLKISKYPVRVICFDNEPDAQRRAHKLVNDLVPFAGETYNVIFSAKDASRSPKKEVREFRKLFLA